MEKQGINPNFTLCKNHAQIQTNMLKIYGISNCDTMKKAFDLLKEKGSEFAFVNYKTEGIKAKKIEAWIAKRGLEVILNKNSTTFKELSPEQKPSTEAEAISLMVQKPSMIKRPVVEKGSKILVGFAELQAAI